MKEQFEKVRQIELDGVLRDSVIGVSIFRVNSEGKREVLLVQDGSGKWYLPGGKMQEGESFDGALRREIKEELGVEYTGGFSSYNIGAYEINGKQLAIANVTALDSIPGQHQVQPGDKIRDFVWTSDPLSYDLTEQVRVVIANQMSSFTMLPKPEK